MIYKDLKDVTAADFEPWFYENTLSFEEFSDILENMSVRKDMVTSYNDDWMRRHRRTLCNPTKYHPSWLGVR